VVNRLQEVALEIAIIQPFAKRFANLIGSGVSKFIPAAAADDDGGSTSDKGITGGVTINQTINDADPSRARAYTDMSLAAAQDARQVGSARVTSVDYRGDR